MLYGRASALGPLNHRFMCKSTASRSDLRRVARHSGPQWHQCSIDAIPWPEPQSRLCVRVFGRLFGIDLIFGRRRHCSSFQLWGPNWGSKVVALLNRRDQALLPLPLPPLAGSRTLLWPQSFGRPLARSLVIYRRTRTPCSQASKLIL